MNLSIFEKLFLVIKNIFSSFLGIELFILCSLLSIILILNINKKNKVINYSIVVFFILFLLILIINNFEYAIYCLDKVLKVVLNYIYFPSPVVYFYLETLVIGLLIFTMFSKKISKFKKIFNYICFNIYNLLFFLFISIVFYGKIDLLGIGDLYSNNSILSIVWLGNFIFVGWFLFTIFYKLYCYFDNKFDKKIEK